MAQRAALISDLLDRGHEPKLPVAHGVPVYSQLTPVQIILLGDSGNLFPRSNSTVQRLGLNPRSPIASPIRKPLRHMEPHIFCSCMNIRTRSLTVIYATLYARYTCTGTSSSILHSFQKCKLLTIFCLNKTKRISSIKENVEVIN